jgi:hypothetical protein
MLKLNTKIQTVRFPIDSVLGGETGKIGVVSLKNTANRKTDSLCLGVEFRPFWKIIAQNKKEKISEIEKSFIWRALCDEARTIGQNNTTDVKSL